MRFDVETISKATETPSSRRSRKLRFDVETISKATIADAIADTSGLRFDVETISKATEILLIIQLPSCGLM